MSIKLLGIPIKLEVSFLVMTVLLSFERAAQFVWLMEWLIVVAVSILLHEFGHALTGRRFGLEPSITLHSFGGLTSWSASHSLKPWQDLTISLAGPMVGFLFGALVFVARPVFLAFDSFILEQAYRDLLWVNIGWGLFNLLPILPMDGGQACATVERRLAAKDEATITPVVSFILALAVAAWGVANRSPWIMFLSGWFALHNGSALWRRRQAALDKPLEAVINEAASAIDEEDFTRAGQLIAQLRQEARTELIRHETAQISLHFHIRKQDFDRAEHELSNYEALYGKALYLRGLFHYAQENWEKTIACWQELMSQESENYDEHYAGLLCHSLIRASRFDEAFKLCGHPSLADEAGELYVGLQIGAFCGGAYDISAAAGKEAFVRENNSKVAYNIACALGREDKIAEGLEWLKRAVEHGFEELDLLNSDEDLEPFRGQTEFAKIVSP